MKRIKNTLLLIILLSYPLILTVHAEASPASPTPKIGFVLPLSGDWAFLGNGIRDGALLAQEDLKKQGKEITLLFEDNQGQLAPSVTAAKKLIEIERADALISIISGVGKLLKPLATQANIINIGICSETEVADGKLSFINYLTAEQGVSKYLDHLGRGKSLGIFALNEAGFQKITDVLRRDAPSAVDIVFVDTFEKGTTDFRPLLVRRSKVHPDALLILGLSPEIETLVTQARLMGITTPVTSIEGFGLASNKSPFEGAWFIDSAVPNGEFRARFSQTYGREVTPGCGHAYDSVMLLADSFGGAVKTGGGIDHAKAASLFRHLHDFSGVTGQLNVQSNGVIWSDASVKVIRNGKPELLHP